MPKKNKHLKQLLKNREIIASLKPSEGDPIYEKSDDIYAHSKKVALKSDTNSLASELDEGLDVPGASLDDQDELIGEEDEENNYYSLGGEDHDDLEQDEND
ncbi:hypothetical protein [Rhizosphaericola mali]|uniref:hypothetical protein n=1 Tax=Rhizosphaericola mali TaxID=2545455 RepID=UPI001CDA095E|nr:hypothetical protein [Rhizosphaericola mali]